MKNHCKLIRAMLKDEAGAEKGYNKLIRALEKAGYHNAALKTKKIEREEFQHAAILYDINMETSCRPVPPIKIS